MWLFGGFLLVIGLLGMLAIRLTVRRFGPSGGITGAGGPERVRQNFALVRAIAVAGALVLVGNLLWVLVT